MCCVATTLQKRPHKLSLRARVRKKKLQEAEPRRCGDAEFAYYFTFRGLVSMICSTSTASDILCWGLVFFGFRGGSVLSRIACFLPYYRGVCSSSFCSFLFVFLRKEPPSLIQLDLALYVPPTHLLRHLKTPTILLPLLSLPVIHAHRTLDLSELFTTHKNQTKRKLLTRGRQRNN